MSQLPANFRYNLSHQQAIRRGLRPAVEAGLMRCARCKQLINPGEPWDVGHVDGTKRTVISGPEHRRCNRATETHKRRRTSRAW